MHSVRIHQDLYNFKRTRKGFTDRQIGGFAIGVGIAVGITLLVGFAIGVPYQIAVTLGLIAGMPAIVAGFMPVYGMPAEEALQRMSDMGRRGNAIGWRGMSVEPMGGEVTRAYRKKAKGKGAEIVGEDGGAADGGDEGDGQG